MRVLTYLLRSGETWPRQLARDIDCDVYAVQSQLARLAAGKVVSSRRQGRMKLYRLNPAYPLLPELRALLERSAAPASPPAERDDRFALIRHVP
ncbi:winged helix-turn-helix transcriptional regulator [candidate division WOR-3 bacterium]|nr:winged helix-turn-helix transcriptional regulator [candidate division WOR-3 bacterium]